MNVSSVKNLNGEVLSAVQDATLTDVVQSNSAQWGQGGEFPDSAYNAITSYQKNSGTYLTDNDIVNKLDISAFTAWSAQEFENDYELSAGEGVGFYEDNELKITRIDVTGGVIPYSAEEAITSYQTNSGNYLQKSETNPTIGTNLTGSTFGLAVGSYSKSFNYGLAVGRYANRYVSNAKSNAAIGYSAHAYGTGSQAFGEQVVVSAGMAIGKNNKTSACSFVIGNGTSNTSRNDIFVINYDGSVSAAGKISANGVELGAGGGDVPSGTMNTSALEYNAVGEISAYNGSALTDVSLNNIVQTNSGSWGGSALPISAGPGIKFELIDNTLVASVTSTPTSGYVWQSASLFHTDTPVTQTTYTLSDNCSNYDRLDVDFYDINNWRTVMECPIPSNLAASGTRGGYFSVVAANTGTGANIWFKAFNWTAAGTTWSCYCSEITAKGGSTSQTVNANQPDNPPKVVNIIGWKRVGGN